MARFDLRCPLCQQEREVVAPIGQPGEHFCSRCAIPMKQFFGKRRELLVNYGFRPHRYDNETDRNIAQYSFEHL